MKANNAAISHFLIQPKLTLKQFWWQKFLAEAIMMAKILMSASVVSTSIWECIRENLEKYPTIKTILGGGQDSPVLGEGWSFMSQ